MESAIRERIEKIEKGIAPDGYKKTKIGIIPEDWEVKKLGGICKITMGQSPKSENYNIIKNGLPLIQGNADMKEGYTKPKLYTSEITKKCQVGDIIMSVRAPVGALAISKHEACIGRGVCRIRANKFIYYYLLLNNNILKRYSQGSTFKAINSSDIRNLSVKTPPLQEQEKIADILSTWDKAIENIDKLIKEKEEQKKGLMQKLLTGEKRLPGFSDEWKEVKLGEICNVISGGTPSTNNLSYWNGDIYWATPTDITKNGKFISYTERKITNQGLKNSSANLLPINSILMTSRATIGERSINTKPMATNQGFKSFVCKKNSHYQYIYYLIEVLKKDFIRMASGSTFLEISKKDTEILKTTIPPLAEQKAIAEILSTADSEIELLNRLLENKKVEKKGLMQLLLTGIVRV